MVNLNKKILVIILSLSLCSRIISMDGRKKFYLHPKNDLGKQALQIASLMRVNTPVSTIQSTAAWLAEQKQHISEKGWIPFVDRFVSAIELGIHVSGATPLEQKKLSNIKEIIKNIAYNLEPGQDCSSLLVFRALTVLDRPSKY